MDADVHEADRTLSIVLSSEPILLGAAVLVLGGVLASKLANRLGVPALLLLIDLGMLAGSDGLGGIEFDDVEMTQGIGVAALALFLTIGLVEIVTGDTDSWWSLLPMFGQQVALGAVLGALGGWLGRLLLNKVNLGIDGLYPVLTLAVAMATYAGTVLLGGSGFLAVYLCGLWLGNREVLHRNSVMRFHDAIAWLTQVGMFLVLGLLVFPSDCRA